MNAAPVLNMLSGTDHPLQALADLLTIEQLLRPHRRRRRSPSSARRNNVARSLAEACALLGAEFDIASPPAMASSSRMRRRHHQVDDPAEAVDGADIVYTDVWVSMGGEDSDEAPRRVRALPGRRSADGARAERAGSCTACPRAAARK